MKIDLHTITTHSKEIFHRLRWGRTGVCCVRCGSTNIAIKDNNHRCRDCDHRFSDTSGTIFHSSKLPLSKWLYAIYLFCTQSRGISSYNLSRLISVSQPTAWRMLHLIRSVIVIEFDLGDTIHVDEVFVGADWKKMPFKQKLKKCQKYGITIPPPRGTTKMDQEMYKGVLRHYMKKASNLDKTCVLGLRAFNRRSLILIPTTLTQCRSLVKSQINAQITDVQRLVTDETNSYDKLTPHHSKNNHSKHIYTDEDGYSNNPLEGAFSHLKRMFKGIYTSCHKKNLSYYLNEFCFRYSYPDPQQRIELIFGWC